jgi:YebC/PmpR family DNA-binding regulatory protein
MAGHNKWSKVKRLKGALDAKRGNLFSRLSKEIALAARMGGGDPSGNARLRSAIQAARAQSMPNDNIERAIKRGTGEDASSNAIEAIHYEAYAPGGVALLIEVATDNRNRAAADIRSILNKYEGNLATSGSVSFQFKHCGQITLPIEAAPEDRVLELALEAGADDIAADDEHRVVLTPPEKLYAVGEALRAAGLEPDSMKLTYLPGNTVPVADERVAGQVVRLCEALEENDDVQSVHSNYELSDELMARLMA